MRVNLDMTAIPRSKTSPSLRGSSEFTLPRVSSFVTPSHSKEYDKPKPLLRRRLSFMSLRKSNTKADLKILDAIEKAKETFLNSPKTVIVIDESVKIVDGHS